MDKNFSGIAISKPYKDNNLNEFCLRFGLNKLIYRKDVLLGQSLDINFEDRYLDLLFLENSTLAFCSSPDIGDSCDIEKSSFNEKSCFFYLDEASGIVMTSIFTNCVQNCYVVKINNELKQSYIKNFSTNLDVNLSLVLETIKYVTGENLFELDNLILKRFDITNSKVYPTTFESLKFKSAYDDFTNPPIPKEALISKNIVKNDNQNKFDIFRRLGSPENKIVADELERLDIQGFNGIILNFIMIVSLFHYDKHIRRKGEIIFRNYASESLIENLNLKWESKFLKSQSINKNKLLEHNEINVGECLCMWQLIRKNYFNRFPATGYNLYLDGKKGVIGEVFNSSTNLLRELPDTFALLKHVTYVKLSKEKKLNIQKIMKSLQTLENLKTLKLAEVGLISLPDEIWEFQNLERLDISGNKISSISSNKKLSNLKELEIYNCEVKVCDCKSFPKIESIEITEWTFNRIDILNIPHKVKIRYSDKFYKILEPGNYYNGKKDNR